MLNRTKLTRRTPLASSPKGKKVATTDYGKVEVMKIAALVPWFGSKRTLAPQIAMELGDHSAYWEPFCGSMSVLLAKPECGMETVNDLHGDLVNLARVIQHDSLGPKMYRSLRRMLCCKEFLDDHANVVRSFGNAAAGDDPNMDRALSYFASSWLGRNGVSGTQSYNQGFSRRFTKSGGHAARRYASAIDSIPAWRKRMRNVTILTECAFSLLDRIEDATGVVIYCDPPYLTKGAKYVHDFADECHARLAVALSRFKKTRVVVSYYDDPRLSALYPKWTKRSFEVTKSLVHTVRRGEAHAKATEVLLINGPSYTSRHGELF